MVKRFRLIAGPNGSGKSTLVKWLGERYKVNFVFDNSASEMDFLGEYEEDAGWIFSHPYDQLPRWFTSAIEED